MIRGQLDDAEGEIADPLQLGGDAHDGHDEAEVRSHGLLAGQQVVAALGERDLHGVDLVVGGHGLLRFAGVAVVEHRAHAFEILVHPHAHQLDLESELLELGLVSRTGRRHVGRRHVSRSGR